MTEQELADDIAPRIVFTASAVEAGPGPLKAMDVGEALAVLAVVAFALMVIAGLAWGPTSDITHTMRTGVIFAGVLSGTVFASARIGALRHGNRTEEGSQAPIA